MVNKNLSVNLVPYVAFLILLVFSIIKLNELESKITTFDQEVKNMESDVAKEMSKIKESASNEKNELEKFKMMAVENKKLISTSQRPEISSIINKWRPYAAYIICSWGDPADEFASGSGKISRVRQNSTVRVLTNKHVLIKDGKTPNTCFVTFPDNSNIYELEEPKIVLMNNDLDIAYLEILNADSKLIALSQKIENEPLCLEDAKLGESIIALGYPSIGSTGDITATEGIVSGFEKDYYISSVKIDHGNSGGIAVSVKNNCYLGMPSAAVTGEVESLARIMMQSVISYENP